MNRLVVFALGSSLLLPAEDAGEILRAGLAVAWNLPQAPQATGQKFKLTVVEDASKFRRARKGRASSQAVVKVTDENDRPVAGIVVSFGMPQLTGGSFSNGGATITSTTNSAGQASAEISVTPTTTNFSISVTASVSGTTLTASIPVSGAAASAAAAGAAGAGAGAGLSGATIGLIVGAVAGGAVAAVCASGNCGGNKNNSPAPVPGPGPAPAPGIRIGIGGASVIGPR